MTGITLTPEELALVGDPAWIQSKNRIMKKVIALMGTLHAGMKELNSLDRISLSVSPAHTREPKISRGENYRGLPYVILDYPRQFSKTSVFALRTMFWWGHYFSISLQVAGEARQQLFPSLLRIARQRSSTGSWKICINQNPWLHHLEEDNFTDLRGMDEGELQSIAAREPFFKISLPFPLQLWENMIPAALREYSALLEELALAP